MQLEKKKKKVYPKSNARFGVEYCKQVSAVFPLSLSLSLIGVISIRGPFL